MCVAPDRTDRNSQFLSEYIIESVENLERLSNEEAPPMKLEDICNMRDAFYIAAGDDADIRKSAAVMEKAFNDGRGDLNQWDPKVLELIDDSFVKHYMKGASPQTCLFFPDKTGNKGRFRKYCDDVDQILRTNAGGAPKYAREYFAYYTTWPMRGYKFPVPLGTATTIVALEEICRTVGLGLVEVS